MFKFFVVFCFALFCFALFCFVFSFFLFLAFCTNSELMTIYIAITQHVCKLARFRACLQGQAETARLAGTKIRERLHAKMLSRLTETTSPFS